MLFEIPEFEYASFILTKRIIKERNNEIHRELKVQLFMFPIKCSLIYGIQGENVDETYDLSSNSSEVSSLSSYSTYAASVLTETKRIQKGQRHKHESFH